MLLVSFATRSFRRPQLRLARSAARCGVTRHRAWSDDEFRRTTFAKQHAEISSHERGGGYWLWKPYVVLDALESVREGELVLYSDVSHVWQASPDALR